MAAPIFSGVVALLYSVNPAFSADQIWELVRTTAKPYAAGSQGASGVNGIGIVDAGAAVAAALKLTR
jgi:serine protease